MTDTPANPEPQTREFSVEVKVGRTKVTVTTLLAPGTDVRVKETNVTTETKPSATKA